MNYMEITIFHVWSFRKKNSTPSVCGAESTNSTSESIRPIVYNDLLLSGRLYSYLADINTHARVRLDLLVAQISEKEGINDQLKEQNQLVWVGAMCSIHNRAEEIINKELIFA